MSVVARFPGFSRRLRAVSAAHARRTLSATSADATAPADVDVARADCFSERVGAHNIWISEGSYLLPSGSAWASRSAFALLRYLQTPGSPPVAEQHVLELGAGSGMLGAGLLALGARRVLLTDGHYRSVPADGPADEVDFGAPPKPLSERACLHDVAKYQLMRNHHVVPSGAGATAALRQLRWGAHRPQERAALLELGRSFQPSLLVGADVTFEPDGRKRLLATIASLLRAVNNPAAAALLAYEVRFEADVGHLFSIAEQSGLTRCNVVHTEAAGGRGLGWDCANDLEVVCLGLA